MIDSQHRSTNSNSLTSVESLVEYYNSITGIVFKPTQRPTSPSILDIFLLTPRIILTQFALHPINSFKALHD